MDDNYHLKGSFPFDEIESIVYQVMKDGIIDESERNELINIFSQFQKVMGKAAIDPSELHINGVCAMNPDISFKDKLFSFTGLSVKAKRRDIADLLISKGGKFKDSVVSSTDFLVIGADGNPCWAFSCYGRKVEAAVSLRKSGNKILLINEHDFWDSCVS
jgi:NAD-dependent DNA ligase